MMARGTGNQMMTDGGWGEERSYVTLAKAGGRRGRCVCNLATRLVCVTGARHVSVISLLLSR